MDFSRPMNSGSIAAGKNDGILMGRTAGPQESEAVRPVPWLPLFPFLFLFHSCALHLQGNGTGPALGDLGEHDAQKAVLKNRLSRMGIQGLRMGTAL